MLSEEPGPHYYHVDDHQLITTEFGPCPAAYYDHTEVEPLVGP